MKKHALLVLLLLATLVVVSTQLFVSNSNSKDKYSAAGDLETSYSVDPLFREFYQQLGGEAILGPAINQMKWDGHLRIQFVEAGKLVYDPQSRPSYTLAPLGLDFGYAEPPVSHPGVPEALFVNGHTVYTEFIPLLQALGGLDVVGSPLTEMRYNPEKNRLEQHFENLGFYKSLNPTNSPVRLLAYGVLSCNFSCRYSARTNAVIKTKSSLAEPFATLVDRLGNSFTGEVLVSERQAADGFIEIIFENIVLFANPEIPGRAYARPIVAQIGFVPQALVERLPTTDDSLIMFFPIEGSKGHNIPTVIYDYIAQHGGLDVTGYPVSEIFLLEEGMYRQCFTNLCLDYVVSAEIGTKVRPAALGAYYKAYIQNTNYSAARVEIPQTIQNARILVWDDYSVVAPGQSQTIYISVLDGTNPVAGAVATLTVTQPDGTQSIYRLPPTGADGQAQITIPGALAITGSLIYYQVCLDNPAGGQVCAHEDYLIWAYP
ncbi:MAG: hypothetical protein OEZ02_01255 [Anaerolineae bacterium]|nr:hypothetical protein [Anaerolineae bacterium]